MSVENATFKGGIHMDDFKSLTSDKAVAEPLAPKTVTIALSQHVGVPCEPLVEVGDHVLVGQKIGDSEAGMSVPVHSSVSGQVVEIKEVYKVDGGKSEAIVIESDGKNELGYEEKALDYENLSSEELITYIREAGLVGLGGAAFPTHIKLSPNKKIDTVLVNGAECEPYLTADQKIMEMAADDIVQGLNLVIRILGAEKAYICIEDNKPNAIKKMREAVSGQSKIDIATLKTKYPQGDERMLINAVLDREVPTGGLPMDVGVVVINSYSVKTIYDAIYKNKPLYERIVTLTGSGLENPQCMLVKNGVSLSYLIENAGGLTSNAEKIVVGGPMMGDAQFTIDAPIVKSTGGVIAFNKEESQVPEETPCINCAKCVDICPVYLEPLNLNKYVKFNDIDLARESHIDACIQCGSCSYVCPANINLAEAIKVGMSEVKRQSARV